MRPSFAFHRPAALAEACALLAAEPTATPILGGTDLMVHLRQPWRGRRPPAVISLRGVADLARVEADGERVRLGAGVSLTTLIDDPFLSREWPILGRTARYMGSPAIRHLATVGGNLCNASPAADLSPVLLTLDASLGIASVAGERRLALADFFRGPGLTALGPGELLAWVEWPRSRATWALRYERLDVRRAMDIALASVAVAIDRDGPAVRDARLALGAVAPIPLRVPAAEAALRELGLGPAGVDRAVELATGAARPIDDVRASGAYRREMIGVLARRGLASVAEGGPADPAAASGDSRRQAPGTRGPA